MNETVRLWSQDYNKLIYSTDDREAAKAFFLASDYDWLPIVIDYGTDWAQRWSGRIERHDDKTAIHSDLEYLKYMTTWPVISQAAVAAG